MDPHHRLVGHAGPLARRVHASVLGPGRRRWPRAWPSLAAAARTGTAPTPRTSVPHRAVQGSRLHRVERGLVRRPPHHRLQRPPAAARRRPRPGGARAGPAPCSPRRASTGCCARRLAPPATRRVDGRHRCCSRSGTVTNVAVGRLAFAMGLASGWPPSWPARRSRWWLAGVAEHRHRARQPGRRRRSSPWRGRRGSCSRRAPGAARPAGDLLPCSPPCRSSPARCAVPRGRRVPVRARRRFALRGHHHRGGPRAPAPGADRAADRHRPLPARVRGRLRRAEPARRQRQPARHVRARPARSWPSRVAGRLLVLALPVLLLWQWLPAFDAIFTRRQATRRPTAAYHQPLRRASCRASPTVVGRIEIPFTERHYEAAYVAPVVGLARGLGAPARHGSQPDLLRGLARPGPLPRSGCSRTASSTSPCPTSPSTSRPSPSVTSCSQRPALPHPGVARRPLAGLAGRRQPGARHGRRPPRRRHARRRSRSTPPRPGPVLVRVRWTPYWSVDGPACARPSGDEWTVLDVRPPAACLLHPVFLGERAQC